VRLRVVSENLSRALDRAPAGPVRLVSLCAGQGHDVLGVLPGHPRREDTSAVLVEANPDNAAVARRGAAEAGLSQVEVREADASLVSGYADALPADVLLLCGIFGNLSDADVERTVAAAPALCAPGATVLWTRHRREPDLTPRIRGWFRLSGFAEVAFEAPNTATRMGIGVHRLSADPAPGLPTEPLFTFGSAIYPAAQG
jgi:hypothetical protein